MWNRDLCIPRFIASSKRVGSQRVGTFMRLVVKRSFTNSRVQDESNSRPRKRAGIDCVSRSRKCDRPHKAHKERVATKRHKRRKRKKQYRNEVVQHSSRSNQGFAATRGRYQ